MLRAFVLSTAAVLAATTLVDVARAQAPAPPPPVAAPVLVPPKRIGSEAVAYPANATGESVVRLVVTVGIDGAVTATKLSVGDEPFATTALEAVKGWKYEPGTRDGKPVAAKILVEIRFVPPKEEPVGPTPSTSTSTSTATATSTSTPTSTSTKTVEEDVDEVRIRGAKSEPGRTVTLGRAEVREIPGAFGDPFRAVEMMPGVTPVISGLPFFFVRGAPPGNVGYFLDGIRVPLLFHVGAGPSVVHPGLIDHVDLYPGGYPARFGRFAGGIVAGETLTPANELHGEFNLRLFDAGALAETPFADGKGSVLVGGRYSYTAALLSYLSPDTTLDYWDYQARATFDLTHDDRIGVFAFGSYDFLGQRTPTETLTVFGTEFHRLDLRHDHRFGSNGTLRTAVTLGLDKSFYQQERSTKARMIGTRTELTERLSDRVVLRAGTDLEIDDYSIDPGPNDVSASQQRIQSLFPSRTDLAFGMRTDLVVSPMKRFEITPGARLDYFVSQGATGVGVDPRLSTRTALSSRTRVLTALGLAHQPPSFVIPVPGVQPGGLRGGLQRAMQESMGLELDLDEGTTATLSLFHNGFFNMTDVLSVNQPEANGCPPGSLPTGSLAGDRGLVAQVRGNGGGACGEPRFTPGKVGPDRTGGGNLGADSANQQQSANSFEARTLGESYGMELFLKRRLTKRIGGFLSYTLSRSTRSFQGQHFVATFDRTHVANAAVAYDLGKGWRAGVRGVFYTGLPKAQTPGDDSTRLPPFFRLDARLEKRWRLGQKAWIAVVAEWLNATLSKEAVSTSCNLQGCTTQEIGPVTIPSLGVEGAF